MPAKRKNKRKKNRTQKNRTQKNRTQKQTNLESQYLLSIDLDISFASMLISHVKKDLFTDPKTARGSGYFAFCGTISNLRRHALEVNRIIDSIEPFLQRFKLFGSGSEFLQDFRVDTKNGDVL